MKILVAAIAICLAACGQNEKAKVETSNGNFKNDTIAPASQPGDEISATLPALASFMDSVANKYVLSKSQIRTNTKIDSNYYTRYFSDAVFTGDTVFNFGRGFKGAIIDYNDKKNCSLKFLLVFAPFNKLNTANTIIFKDCDVDQSTGGTMVNYKLLTDSTFETIETDIPSQSAESSTGKKKIFKCKINDKGMIDSLRKM